MTGREQKRKYLLCSYAGPIDLAGVALGKDPNVLTVNDQVSIGVADGAFEDAVSRVVLELVGHVLGRQERVIDADHLQLLFGEGKRDDAWECRQRCV